MATPLAAGTRIKFVKDFKDMYNIRKGQTGEVSTSTISMGYFSLPGTILYTIDTHSIGKVFRVPAEFIEEDHT